MKRPRKPSKGAKFRNVLAHTYARVNLEITYTILQQKLNNIEKLYKKLIKELK